MTKENKPMPMDEIQQRASHWCDASILSVEGKGWLKTESFYDRLPRRAASFITLKHWKHAQCPAGMVIRFSTDAPTLAVRWDGVVDHAGVSGLDLYACDQGRWRWVSTAKANDLQNQVELFTELPICKRDFMLYAPLFHQVQRIEIGVPQGFDILPAPRRQYKPIVFYGTSIMQGSRASRAGMTASAILGRQLDWPILNLGFSGSGNMEPQFIELLCELDPAVYVIDCLPNMLAPLVEERLVPAVLKLRDAHPTTPIVLVDMVYCDAWFKPARRQRMVDANEAQRIGYEKLVQQGVANLLHVSQEDLPGQDNDATIDGTHYTDVGFMRYANLLIEPLRSLIQKTPEKK